MGNPTDLNVTGKETGAFAADLGIGNEFIVTGILIRLGFDVGVMQVTRTPFDIWLYAFESPKGNRVSLRVQTKTISKSGSIKLGAGTRGGVDREYKSDLKEYKYTSEHNDVIIGVDRDTFDLYIIPTRIINKWGKSKSIRLLQPLKNNWDIFLNWNTEYLDQIEAKLADPHQISKGLANEQDEMMPLDYYVDE